MHQPIELLAMAYQNEGDLESAASYLERGLETTPNDLDLLEQLAWVMLLQERGRESVDLYHRICEMGRCNQRVRGNLVYAQGQYQAEAGVLEETIAAANADPTELILH